MIDPSAVDRATQLRTFGSWEAMEGATSPAARPLHVVARSLYPGLLVAVTIAIAAAWLSQHYGAPVMLFALTFGMAFHFLHEDGRCVAGVEFASKTILRIGVALLGARITAQQIWSLGWAPVALVVIAVASTVLLGAVLGRLLRLGPTFGILSGGSVAICGASAALAIASVLPKSEKSERDLILVVMVVTALSTVAMVLYPVLATWLGLTETTAGLFLGGTIHDVAQVVGAGYTISTHTGDVATYVKLLRVALLLPVVFGIAMLLSRRGARRDLAPPLPLFLFGFAALVLLNSLIGLPSQVAPAVAEGSRWCLVVAIAALGMKTSFKALFDAGWRPVAAMAIETAWIAAVVLIGVAWLT